MYTSLALFPYVGSSASVAVTWIIDVPAGRAEEEGRREEGQRGNKEKEEKRRRERK